MKRILITGATGFVGRRLVSRLIKEGYEVIAVTRDADRARAVLPSDVEVIVSDIVNGEELVSDLGKVDFDVVYHLAAELDEASPDLWKVNVEGTKNVIEAIRGRPIERLIYLSSSGVLGSTNGPAKEDMPYNPETKYEESKAEAERIITYAWLKYQIPYTIVRSTIIYGPNKIFADILKAAKSGYPIIGSGKNRFHLIYIDDVVDALVSVLDSRASNKIYHIAGPDVYTYEETYALMCRLLGVKLPDTHIPKSAAIAAASAYSRFAKLMKKKPGTTMLPSSIKRLTRDRVIDISLIRRDLGWTPKVKLEEGLKKTIKQLQKRGML